MIRFGYLDALRGLAILGVALAHAGQAIALTGPLAYMTAFGTRGVQLFYMVSAFTLLTVARSPFDSTSFFIRRFFRIAPAYYVALLVFLIVDGLAPRYYAPDGVGIRQVILVATFLHGWAPDATNAIIPGAWSVACEMMFYLAFPLLIRHITSLRAAMIGLCIASAVSLTVLYDVPRFIPGPEYLAKDFVFFSIFVQAPAFLVGFVIFYMPKLRSARWAYAMAGLAVAMIALLIVGGRHTAHFALAIPPFALLLWGMSSFAVRPLDNPLTRALGKVSFSLYLCHILILRKLVLFIDEQGPSGLLMIYGAALLIGGTVSALSYVCIEQPFIRLGRRLTSGGAKRPIASEPAPSQRW